MLSTAFSSTVVCNSDCEAMELRLEALLPVLCSSDPLYENLYAIATARASVTPPSFRCFAGPNGRTGPRDQVLPSEGCGRGSGAGERAEDEARAVSRGTAGGAHVRSAHTEAEDEAESCWCAATSYSLTAAPT
eukprot:767359-Hanusia_phi.AAC.9